MFSQGLEEELGNEFDNVSDEDSSQSSEDDAADDGTFGKFLKGIVNPKEEFPEEESMHDVSRNPDAVHSRKSQFS